MEAVGTHVALRSSQLCLYQNWSSALLVFGVPSVPLIQCAFPLLFSCKCAAFKKAFASHYPLVSCFLDLVPGHTCGASVTLAHQHITARLLWFFTRPSWELGCVLVQPTRHIPVRGWELPIFGS